MSRPKQADLTGTNLMPFSHQSKASIQKGLDKSRGLMAIKKAQEAPSTLPPSDEESPVRELIQETQPTTATEEEGDPAAGDNLTSKATEGPEKVGLFAAYMRQKQAAGRGLGPGRGQGPGAKYGPGAGLRLGARRQGGQGLGVALWRKAHPLTDKQRSEIAACQQRKGRTVKQGSLRFADPVRQKYPLDAYDDVVEANRYFDKYAAEFDPITRRMMATNIFNRCSEIGIPSMQKVAEEAMRKVASVEAIRSHLFARSTFYGRDTEAGQMYRGLMDKAASLHPQVMMEVVAQLDARYGGADFWETHLPNPQDVVFEKTAQEESKSPAEYSYDFGTWRVSGTDLVRLARRSKHVDARFGHEFAELFRDDPIGFFNHLPTPEKEVMGRMAHDLDSPGVNHPQMNQ